MPWWLALVDILNKALLFLLGEEFLEKELTRKLVFGCCLHALKKICSIFSPVAFSVVSLLHRSIDRSCTNLVHTQYGLA